MGVTVNPHNYEIHIEGQLGESWSPWLGGLVIHNEENGVAVLTGTLSDESALHGVLMKIHNLGLPLLSVTRLD